MVKIARTGAMAICMICLAIVALTALAMTVKQQTLANSAPNLHGMTESSEELVSRWNKTYGGTDRDYAYAMVQDRDGGYAVVGETHSFGPYLHNFYLVKTDASGNLMWNQTYGSGDCEAYDIIQTRDGGWALTGTKGSGYSQDYWLVKTDAFGNLQWNQTYGNPSPYWEAAYSLIQTPDDGYLLAGGTGPYDYGNDSPNADFWLVKTDSNGVIQWNKTYGGPYDDQARRIIPTTDNGFVVIGHTWSYGAGNADVWLIRTDMNGIQLWNKTFGGTGKDWANCVIQTTDGGYAIAAQTNSFGAGNYDFWLLKTYGNGTIQWSHTFGGIYDDDARSVVQITDGYAIAGATSSFGAGNWDVWLVKTDLNGQLQWNRTYGGANEDWAYPVIQTGDGGYAMAGYTCSFGGGTPGNPDVWLIKTDSQGIVPESISLIALPLLSVAAVVATIAKRRTILNRKLSGSSKKHGMINRICIVALMICLTTLPTILLVTTKASVPTTRGLIVNAKWEDVPSAYYPTITNAMNELGIPYDILNPETLTLDILRNYRFVFIPSLGPYISPEDLEIYNPEVFADMLEQYVNEGGSLMFCPGHGAVYGENMKAPPIFDIRYLENHRIADFKVTNDTHPITQGPYRTFNLNEQFYAHEIDLQSFPVDANVLGVFVDRSSGTEYGRAIVAFQRGNGKVVASGLQIGWTSSEPATDNGVPVQEWKELAKNAITWLLLPEPTLLTVVDFVPNSLNLVGKEMPVTAYLEPTRSFSSDLINVSSILLNGTVGIDASMPTTVGDYDGDGFGDLMVKFDKTQVIGYILSQVDTTELCLKRTKMSITLTITGAFNDGTLLRGSETLIVSLPKGKPVPM